MDRVLTFQGRLPGVLVETALPARRESPLRLDVAGFVGFAERGPLNTPVALEDLSGYRHVFGGDFPLATEQGTLVFAHLPSAVKAFFDNGGRRCYVVRVAGASARANLLPLPGLAAVGADGDFVQGMVAAAWVGHWSDAMSVRTQLRTFPLRIAPGASYAYDAANQEATLQLELPAAAVAEGDVLRLHFAADGGGEAMQVLLRVASVRVTGPFSVRGFPTEVLLHSMTEKAAFGSLAVPPPDAPNSIECLAADGWQGIAGALPPIVTKTGGDAGQHLFLAQGAPVAPGTLLRITFAAGEVIYFPVVSVRTHYAPPAEDTAAVAALAEQGDPPLPEGVYLRAVTDELLRQQAVEDATGTLQQVERLRFDLAIYEGEKALDLLQDLHFNPPAAYWAEVQAQKALELGTSGGASAAPAPIGAGGWAYGGAGAGNPAQRAATSDFWADRLARVKDDARPVELGAFGGRSLHLRAINAEPLPPPPAPGAPAVWLPLAMRGLPTVASVLPEDAAMPLGGKDGLDVFDAPGLFLDPQLALATTEGLLQEAEAILYLQQPPGVLRKLHALVGIEELGLIAVPDLLHRPWQEAGAPPTPLPPAEPPAEPPPPWQDFVRCEVPATTDEPPYDPQKAPCTDSPLGLLPSMPATTNGDTCAPGVQLPELQAPALYDVEPLLRVQRALVTLCAARADVLAVLGIPAHFGRSETLDWQDRLANTPALLSGPALSYAAAYHPWVLLREESCPALAPVRKAPPDGVVCGLIARRERARGVWIAPANEPLLGIIGLTPALGDADWEALYNRQVNLLRPQPGRFAAMSAFTLSADRLLLPISVRRLLIFLRKLALRRGQQFVFETNNERFRRQVQVSFERVLTALVERGALAAFQVVTSEEVNTPNDAYNGRFLVALKVAPTLPIEFITVVMLRTGESLLEVLER